MEEDWMRTAVGQEPPEGEPIEVVVPVRVVIVVRLFGVRTVSFRDWIKVGRVKAVGKGRFPRSLLLPYRFGKVQSIEELMALDLVSTPVTASQPRFGLATQTLDQICGLGGQLVPRDVQILPPMDNFCLSVGNAVIKERGSSHYHFVQYDTD